jgi:hypothetical protein
MHKHKKINHGSRGFLSAPQEQQSPPKIEVGLTPNKHPRSALAELVLSICWLSYFLFPIEFSVTCSSGLPRRLLTIFKTLTLALTLAF